MSKSYAISLVSFLLASCASGVVPIGPDTYMLSDTGAYSWSSGGNLKANIYRDAYVFCQKQGKEMMPASTHQNDANFSNFAHAEVQFRCLAKGDPELQRPVMKTSPNIVIQSN